MNAPQFHVLSDEMKARIIDEAMEVLEKVGFFIENEEARSLLGDNGIRIDGKERRAYCPRQKMLETLTTVPRSIRRL